MSSTRSCARPTPGWRARASTSSRGACAARGRRRRTRRGGDDQAPRRVAAAGARDVPRSRVTRRRDPHARRIDAARRARSRRAARRWARTRRPARVRRDPPHARGAGGLAGLGAAATTSSSPSNLVTLLRTAPAPYWAPMMKMFETRLGSLKDESALPHHVPALQGRPDRQDRSSSARGPTTRGSQARPETPHDLGETREGFRLEGAASRSRGRYRPLCEQAPRRRRVVPSVPSPWP